MNHMILAGRRTLGDDRSGPNGTARRPRSRQPRRVVEGPRPAWRQAAIPAALVAVAVALGYWGLSEYLVAERAIRFGRGFLDLTYYNAQLFVLDSALAGEGAPVPVPLRIARILAPMVTVYAAFEVVRTLSADRWYRWRLRRLRGHSIVTGKTAAAHALAATLHGEVVTAPAGTTQALVAAGVIGARALYACADDTEDCAINIATAYAAAALRESRPTLDIHAQVSDPVLATALRARRLSATRPDQPRLTFFNLEQLAAHEIVRRQPVDCGPVVIAGLGTFGQRLLVEIALSRRLRRSVGVLPAVLVDPDAARIATDLTAAWPVVADNCAISTASSVQDVDIEPQRIYLCYPDEGRSLHIALTAARMWVGGPHSIVIRLDRLATHATTYQIPGDGLLDDLGGRLWLVSVTGLACRPNVVSEDIVEHLARAIHDNYLADQLGKGEATGIRPSMLPWDDLAEDYRRASRDQARHIGAKLAAIGCTVAPLTPQSAPFRYTSTEVERLAELEHRRWSRERTATGWIRGQQRDDDAKRHPSLVAWGDLTEEERDKDRAAIRRLPRIMQDVGLAIVRLDRTS